MAAIPCWFLFGACGSVEVPRQLGLYMKNWRKAEERDAALVTEKSEGLGSRYGGHVPFGEVFSQMWPGKRKGARSECAKS